MADKKCADLVKIGPGLGRRSKIWTIVKKKLSTKSKHLQILTSAELSILDRLTEGTNWTELVPDDWKETYGIMYDEAGTREPIVTKTRDQIIRDVPRTFSLYIEHARYLRLQFPNDMKPYCDALQGLLEVACHQNFGCGYCQGMNFLAATFLLSEGNQRSAFILMSYLLKQCHLEILYNPKCSSLLEYMEYYEQRLAVHNPTVYQHLQNEEFPPLCYTVEWFTTCFLVSSPGELSACVIDLILCGYEDIMIRVGLALMDHLETVILHSNAEKLQLNFKKMLLLANCVEVMTKALTIPSDNIEGVSRIEFMKLNCASMDPNDEWVNTMQACRIHKGGDEGTSNSCDPLDTPQDSSCTCSTPPPPDYTDEPNTANVRHNSVDIGVLHHSHSGKADFHSQALIRAHAQSSPTLAVCAMAEHTINEDYIQGTQGVSGTLDMEVHDDGEQEHSSVDSPAAPALSSISKSCSRTMSNINGAGGGYDTLSPVRHASHSFSHSSSSRSGSVHKNSSTANSASAHTSKTAASGSPDKSSSSSRSKAASSGDSKNKDTKKDKRPSSASVISTAFKALYK